ncbi:ankyrin repeat domain-containing protein [Thiorhodococcus minor]|uniref:Ankyrin repeat domain-containing protein n=1 Tax=Thiorhodococcus minor TaxID=57489 RepID=A0A6M0K0I6_9GAMM|nr:ankyrin repeat domain-containing protein [Thiorhodococcus minor]NEV63298.1 ankyrin repeat domain-containing protein [Thiorhodococcus minor]
MKITQHLILTLVAAVLLGGCGRSDDSTTAMGGGEALLEVAEQGDLQTVNQLLDRHGQPDVRDSCDWTPLMKAALHGHRDVVERLIQAGAEIDAADKGGYTAMMLAASNNHADVVQLLLERGAMVDHQESTKGWTALIWAAKQGHAKSVAALLAGGADETLKDYEGNTAADWARQEHPEVLELLQG